MEFLSFLTSWARGLDYRNPQFICLGLVMLFFAFTKRWLLVFMSLGTIVIGKAIEFYVPESTSAFVGDLSMVQVVYIVASIIIVITGLGQMVLRN